MKRRPAKLLGAVSSVPTALALSTLLVSLSPAVGSLTPEQETLALSKVLKPIPDDMWQEIAGTKLDQQYMIEKGDTLYDISKRLFGDPTYWPKIWALNNNTITNPHLILPRNRIAFLAGTGTELPQVEMKGANGETLTDAGATGAEGGLSEVETQAAPGEEIPPEEVTEGTTTGAEPPLPRVRKARKSQDWKKLPRQPWERFSLPLPPEVDPLGFDRRSKIKFKNKLGIDPPIAITSQKFEPVAEIVSARTDAETLSLLDTIFVKADRELHPGDTFTVIEDPTSVSIDDRDAYIYPVAGKVVIEGQENELWRATVLNQTGMMNRGHFLIPVLPKVGETGAITPAAQAVEGTMKANPIIGTYTTSQHKLVLVNRGTADGVQPTNVFRIFDHHDPRTGDLITKENTIAVADILVLDAREQISLGVVIRGKSYINDDSPVVLLTNVNDILKRGYNPETMDELDALDKGQGLDAAGERELKQLEKWKSNPEPTPSPLPQASATPEPSAEPSPAPAPSGSPEPLPNASPSPGFSAPPPESVFPEPVQSEGPPKTEELPPPQETAPAQLPNEPGTATGLSPGTPAPETAPPAPESAPAPDQLPPPPADEKALDQLMKP